MFQLHEDPGHGWLQVPITVIRDLGISSQISSCSYIRSGYVYLEEDCDLALFMQASGKGKEWLNNLPRKQYDVEAPIRGYAPYSFANSETDEDDGIG